jgi:WD40 repeat protein
MAAAAGPEGFTVRILGPDGTQGGLGVLVGERHIVTCAHVVNTALGRDQRAQHQPAAGVGLAVDFPLLEGNQRVAVSVAAWLPPPDGRNAGDDVAGLLLDGPGPDGAAIARLAVEPPRPGQVVRVFGYPRVPDRPGGAWVSATVRGSLSLGRLQVDSVQESALRVQPGFSGSALYDDESGRVIAVLAVAPPGVAQDRDSYAIRADQLRLAWPQVLAGRWQRVERDAAGTRPDGLTILHVTDLQFGNPVEGTLTAGSACANGREAGGSQAQTAAERAGEPLFGRLHHDLAALGLEHDLHPDILVVDGLASQGLPSEFRRAMAFIGALAEAAEIPRRHVVIVPGSGDINQRASAAYFAEADAEEKEPVFPYWPKWKQFAAVLTEFYTGIDEVTFTPDEPWTLFEMPDLSLVVAGINTTMAGSHRPEDHYGLATEHQLRWFEARLATYQQRGWLRLAAAHHMLVRDVTPGGGTSRTHAGQILRDADDLDRVLGRGGLISLALHGNGGSARIDRLSSGLIAVSPGALSTGQYQLITLRRGTLRRYARRYEATQRRWIGDTGVSANGSDWHEDIAWTPADVDAALPPPAVAGAQFDTSDHYDQAAGEERPEPRPLGAVNEFLDRVAEATRVRYPEATVTSRPEEKYLRVTQPRLGGAIEQRPIGVIDGPATDEALDAFITRIHAPFASADAGVPSELIYTAPPAPGELVVRAQRAGVRLRSFTEYQGLLDLSQLAQAQNSRLAIDRLYPPQLYIQQRYRIISGGGHSPDIREGLVGRAVEWLGAEGARLVVVLGDFGRGKTSFLRQLTRTVPAELPSVIPILVELRHLEKAPTLDELLMQHLVRQDVRGDISTAKLRYMISSGRVALLFDGFDELELRVGYEHAAEYLQTLLDSVTGQAKVILTSRTQHFPSTDQVRTALGKRLEDRADSRVVVLEDFTDEQILEFLARLHPADPQWARTRFDLISGIANLLDLAHNPRILTFVADLDEDRLLAAARDKAGQVTAAALYAKIIDFWLSREEERQSYEHGLRPITKDERLDACTKLALRLWTSRDPQLAMTVLSTEVTDTLTDLAERGYTSEQAAHSIASGSLLVRNEDGTFSFIHQSVMEWLVAHAAARRVDGPDGGQILAMQQMSQLMAEFFTDLVGVEKALLWTTTTLSGQASSEIAKQNALAVARRVGLKPQAQLAAVDLREQDLSRQDLRGANLRGANLSGMNLSETDFLGANLSDADFRGARMTGGSLRGAMLSGSRWDRAVILGTADLPDPVATPEISAAAIAGRDQVDIMLPLPGDVSSVAFSPVTGLMAIGRGSHVQLVDTQTSKTLRLLTGHSGTINDVAFSFDGNHIATASEDRTARVWETSTGATLTTLFGHGLSVGGVAFSPDGATVATSSDDKTARTWNVATGTHLTTFNGHADWVRSVAFSPDGTLIATASRDGTARTWDTATGTQRRVFSGHSAWVRRVAFSPDGTLIATASRDGTARIWDTVTGGPRTSIRHHPIPAQSSASTLALNGVAFSPDGTLIATASRDRTAVIWNVATGREVRRLKGHSDWVRVVQFSPDGSLVATASRDGSAMLWDTASGLRRASFRVSGRAGVTSVACSPDGTCVAATSADGTTRVWGTARGTRPGANAFPPARARQAANAVAFSPNRPHIAVASEDGTARILDIATKKVRAVLKGHSGEIRGVAFSPDGTLIATGSNDTTARLWDADTGAHLGTMNAHRAQVTAVAFAPDGTRIATASEDRSVRIWSLTGRRPVSPLFRWRPSTVVKIEHFEGEINAVAFSPDGTLVAASSNDTTTALVWDASRGAIWRRLSGHAASVRAVAFSPDGSFIATASRDGTARIWDVATGLGRTTMRGHEGPVTTVAFSCDGMLIATGSDDGSTRIWDVATGTALATLLGLPGGGHAMLLTDGRYHVREPGDDMWWTIKLCRFGPGELDQYVPGLRPIAVGERIFPPPRET